MEMSVEEMSVLLVEIRIFWRSSGRRDVGDVGFGGWSRRSDDVAVCTWSRRLRGLRNLVAIGGIGLFLFVIASLTALGYGMACMSWKRAL